MNTGNQQSTAAQPNQTQAVSVQPLPLATGPTRLPRRSSDTGPLRVVTLGWQRTGGAQSSATFLADLEDAIGSMEATNVDLIQCAGWPVDAPAGASDILRRTQGISVLYETGGSGAWELVYEDGLVHSALFRTRQHVVSSQSPQAQYETLIDELGAGYGVACFDGLDVPVIFLICGENNACGYHDDATSALWYAHRSQALRSWTAGRWIALNSAHLPYLPQGTWESAFGKVGPVNGYEPVLSRKYVASNWKYSDGTQTPVALIHANNVSLMADGEEEHAATAEYAGVCFQRSAGVSRVTPTRATHASSRRWFANLFEITV